MQTTNKMSNTSVTNAAAMAVHASSGVESDPKCDSDVISDSEWVDDVLESIGANPEKREVEKRVVSLPSLSILERENIPQKLRLENFCENESGSTSESGRELRRDEAIRGKWPGVSGLKDVYKDKEQVHLYTFLWNSNKEVQTRTPDIKQTQGSFIERAREKEKCAVLDLGDRDTIYFKKKCIRQIKCEKTGKVENMDVGFELSGDFAAYTAGKPYFCFVAVPWDNGYFIDRAVRSQPFFVRSKRQGRYLNPKKRKTRKWAEIQKLETDKRNAKTTLQELNEKITHYDFANSATDAFFELLRVHIPHVRNDTARTALEFALRATKENDTVSM